jgi:probable F420-dependent oxidoreductase
MKVGVFLGSQLRSEDDPVRRAGEYVEQVKLMVQAGYDSVWLGQHYVTAPDQYFQPMPLLGRIAADAGVMILGTNIVLLPLHHPVEIAEQFATLDALTGGRIVLGVGLGYREEEFAAFGIPIKTRVGRMTESIEIIKRLWTEDALSFEGKYFRLDKVSIRPRPVQKPRPPIWVGAVSEPAIRRAAVHGDAWMAAPQDSVAKMKELIALYRQARTEAGLPPAAEFGKILDMYVAPTREQAWRDGAPAIAEKYRSYAAWGLGGGQSEGQSLDTTIEELARNRFVIGDPDDCIQEFRRHRDELGVTHLMIRVQFPGMTQRQVMDCLRLVGERVLPALRGDG